MLMRIWCIHIIITTQRRRKTSEEFFRKIYTSQFISKVGKGCVGIYCQRELETEQNCNILTPLLWPTALCLSCSPGLLKRRPRGPALCWMTAFFTGSYQQLLWTPTQSGAPSPFGLAWLSLPHLVYNSVRSLTVWLLVLTELYNSSTPTQSPIQSLEWHV